MPGVRVFYDAEFWTTAPEVGLLSLGAVAEDHRPRHIEDREVLPARAEGRAQGEPGVLRPCRVDRRQRPQRQRRLPRPHAGAAGPHRPRHVGHARCDDVLADGVDSTC